MYPVSFLLNRSNRNSVAAVLAVLETELPGLLTPRLLGPDDAFDGEGLLALSFTSDQRATVGALLETLRANHGPRLLTVAGGCDASARPEETLAMGFRWVVAGEAGRAFAGLVRELASGGVPAPGVLEEQRSDDLDRYPPWPLSGQLFAPIELTRGCAMGCGFCQTPRLFGRRPRQRSLAALERIFARAVETSHRYTRFVAPNAFGYGSPDGLRPAPREVERLLVLARRSGLEELFFGTFPSEVRPESVTEEMLGLVRDHCANRTLAIGLQSGSDRLLRHIGRGHTVRQGVEAVERIARGGFVPQVDFIFGLPSETDDDRAQTRALIGRLTEDYGACIHPHRFTPLPGTPLADAAPAEIDPDTASLMESLAGSGKVTGIGGGQIGACPQRTGDAGTPRAMKGRLRG